VASDPTTEAQVGPGPYDVDTALRELARTRRRRDLGTQGTLQLADRLAASLQGNFSVEEMETVGRTLIIAAASTGALLMPGQAPRAGREDLTVATLICNITAFAGERLIRDARAIDEAGLS